MAEKCGKSRNREKTPKNAGTHLAPHRDPLLPPLPRGGYRPPAARAPAPPPPVSRLSSPIQSANRLVGDEDAGGDRRPRRRARDGHRVKPTNRLRIHFSNFSRVDEYVL
eukprot:1195953-Prorocentrum_minimum.AAC.4